MKQRFSSLDVKVIAHELAAALVTLRLANVYDLSSRIFLLKFAKPEHREQLVIDSGFRCHLTRFARATAAAPTPFVARLRKFLRTRRVTCVRQIGTDRVIELQFSDGAYNLYLEFYAGGNIVLTDRDLTVLALFRHVSEGAEHEQYRPGSKYDLSLRQNSAGVPSLSKERVRSGLLRAVEKQQEDAQKPGKKLKKKAGDALRRALALATPEFPPVLIDHALFVSEYDRDVQPQEVAASEALLDKLLDSLRRAHNVVREITSRDTAKGYILARPSKTAGISAGVSNNDDAVGKSGLMYDDFHPFKPAHLTADPAVTVLEFDGFNRTADEFFSSIEGQKLESRLQERQDTARRKIEQARQEQAKRIDGLQQVQEANVRKAQAIQANVERVEETTTAVNGLIAQGMDWVDIGRLIENEQKRRNPVAQMIKLPLKLEENTITILLSEFAEAEDEGFVDETDSEPSDSEDGSSVGKSVTSTAQAERRLAIDVDLALSPWANARQYYEQRRSAAVKQEKTASASQRALKSTEAKVMADLKKGLKQEKEVLRPVRKQMWFEKFIYFFSSDGYLVLAGRDAQQNEILYRRYLKKGDVYVHADLHGAASVIIKNHVGTPDAPIPPGTLSQAGHLAVCSSSAWESKAVMSAWWVTADQVSKTAPTGEYLTTGGFMVRGKKNYLPPAQLLLGLAIVWQISEESKGRHRKHRFDEGDAEVQITADDGDNGVDVENVADAEAYDEGDEFPDATVPPEDVEDDDFPDAIHAKREEQGNAASIGHDEGPEEEEDFKDEDDAHDRDEDDGNEPRETSNPLQPKSAADALDRDSENKVLIGVEEGDKAETGEDDGEEDVDSDRNEERLERYSRSAQPVDSPAAELGTNSAQITGTSNEASKETILQAKSKPAPQVRGKRGKIKKFKSKYANQDEEDREVAMKLLGSRAAIEKREGDAAAKVAKQESAEEARARRRAQHEKAQKEGLEAEEIRRLNFEEGVEALDGDDSNDLTQLDALVGTPLPDDEILEAIPICAPWTALTKYKYKAKLQPGQQKKGKAVREVLGKWIKDAGDARKVDQQSQDTERIWPREAELIRALKEAEVVGIIPVKNVRVMMSGGGAGGEKGKGGARGGKGGGRGGKGSKRSK